MRHNVKQAMDYNDRYLLFIEYFNGFRFMSAQTTLDTVWLHEDGENKDFYGGLIQVAVAMYHLTSGNPEGASKIYSRARQMIEKYGEEHLGLYVKKLISDLDQLFSCDLDVSTPPLAYFQRIPKIEFKEKF